MMKAWETSRAWKKFPCIQLFTLGISWEGYGRKPAACRSFCFFTASGIGKNGIRCFDIMLHGAGSTLLEGESHSGGTFDVEAFSWSDCVLGTAEFVALQFVFSTQSFSSVVVCKCGHFFLPVSTPML